jgi:dihydrofolate synthase/folylpolyglutamate synthase
VTVPEDRRQKTDQEDNHSFLISDFFLLKRIDMFAKNSEFKEALHWLNQTSRFGMKLDLDNIQTLLEALDHPHQTLKVIHVAGTNGKGSTCAMLTSVLMKAGYKVGLYTSPHLISLRERIKVNGEWISEDDFVQGIHLLRAVVRKKGNLYPTYFELMTALAFDHFFKNRVDIVVLEAGMGGRLDSTNIAGSRVQIITNIHVI